MMSEVTLSEKRWRSKSNRLGNLGEHSDSPEEVRESNTDFQKATALNIWNQRSTKISLFVLTNLGNKMWKIASILRSVKYNRKWTKKIHKCFKFSRRISTKLRNKSGKKGMRSLRSRDRFSGNSEFIWVTALHREFSAYRLRKTTSVLCDLRYIRKCAKCFNDEYLLRKMIYYKNELFWDACQQSDWLRIVP